MNLQMAQSEKQFDSPKAGIEASSVSSYKVKPYDSHKYRNEPKQVADFAC